MKLRYKTTKTTIGLFMTTVICLTLAASAANAQTVYFADYFEEGLGRWEVAGDTWQLTDLFSRSANHCASDSPQGNYSLNANSTIEMKLQYRVNLSDSIQPVLIFWHRVGVSEGDYAYVEISQDYGFNWTEIESFTETYRSTWSRVQIDLSEYKSNAILIRFRLRDDGYINIYGRHIVSFGWDIDDVEIRELDTTTLQFPLFDDFESGLGNWDTGWELSESTYRSETHSIVDSDGANYPLSACSDLILAHPIDISNSVFPVLKFWHRVGVNSGDFATVEISQDYGFSWTEVMSFTNTEYSGWVSEIIDLSPYKSSPILIRFRVRDDSYVNIYGRHIVSSGWEIDDVEIVDEVERTVTLPFFDDFENGGINWVVAGDTWGITKSTSRSGNYSMADSNDSNYLLNASSILTLAYPLDLTESVSPVLSFWHRVGVSEGDYAYVEISQDYGLNWTEVTSFTETNRSTWSRVQIDLSEYKSNAVLVRFRLRDDGYINIYGRHIVSFGWDIDDVEIRELDTTTLQFPLFDDFESGLGNWDSGWELSESTYRSLIHSIVDSNDARYPLDACSDLILSHPINIPDNSGIPALKFWHRVGVSDGDFATVEISQDYGLNWMEVMSFTNTEYSGWVPELIDLSPYKGMPILIRFRVRDNGYVNIYGRHIVSSGWEIDDVSIDYLVPPPTHNLKVEMTGLTASACPTIHATVIVADESGNSITGLPPSAFSVTEDGNDMAATAVELTSQPVCVSLVLDFSGSMPSSAIDDLQWAAEQFVNLMGPEDAGEVIKFANGVDVTQDYTLNKDQLIDAIYQPFELERTWTHLYDAIDRAILDTTARDACIDKAIVVMTDGQSNVSDQSATGIIKIAKEEGIRIFTIGLGSDIDEDVLTAIATQTGGLYKFAPNSADLITIYQAIAVVIKNQYLVTYETTACGPEANTDLEHEVTITVSAAEGIGQDTERFVCPAECTP